MYYLSQAIIREWRTVPKRVTLIFSITLLLLLGGSLTGSACIFTFNYQEIEAPLGVIGTIGIRVQKDHQNCSMEGRMEYQLEWSNIQVLEETEWREVGQDLYEKRLQVLLSEVGSGYFLISKDCEREGYGEKRLPITIREGTEVWEQAFLGEYPYETEKEIDSLRGPLTLEEDRIRIKDTSIQIQHPHTLENLKNGQEVVVYYVEGEEKRATLLVGEGFFYKM